VLPFDGRPVTASGSGSDVEYNVGPGTQLTPGGELTLDGTTYSLPASGSGSVVVVNGHTSTVAAVPPAEAAPVLSIGDNLYTAASISSAVAFVLGTSTTLTAGGAITVEGTTYSLPKSGSGSVVVVNGQTSKVASAPLATDAPVLSIGDTAYTATSFGSSLGYVLGPGTTLTPGAAITSGGTTYSLPASASGSVVIINGHTTTLGPAPPATAVPVLTFDGHTYTASVSGSSTVFVLGGAGETLTPGGVLTVDGTRLSWGPGSTQVVVGSSTESLGLATPTGTGMGGYIATGIGVEPFKGGSEKACTGPVLRWMALLGVGWVYLTFVR